MLKNSKFYTVLSVLRLEVDQEEIKGKRMNEVLPMMLISV